MAENKTMTAAERKTFAGFMRSSKAAVSNLFTGMKIGWNDPSNSLAMTFMGGATGFLAGAATGQKASENPLMAEELTDAIRSMGRGEGMTPEVDAMTRPGAGVVTPKRDSMINSTIMCTAPQAVPAATAPAISVSPAMSTTQPSAAPPKPAPK